MDVAFSGDGQQLWVSTARGHAGYQVADGAELTSGAEAGRVVPTPDGARVAGWDGDVVWAGGVRRVEPPTDAIGVTPDGAWWLHPRDGQFLSLRTPDGVTTRLIGAYHAWCRGWSCVTDGGEAAVIDHGEIVFRTDHIQDWVPGGRYVRLDGRRLYDLERHRRVGWSHDEAGWLAAGATGAWVFEAGHTLVTLGPDLSPTARRDAPELRPCSFDANRPRCAFDPVHGRMAVVDEEARTWVVVRLDDGAVVSRGAAP